jgi:universal stress protein E
VVHAYHVRSQILRPTGIDVEEFRNAVARLHRERLDELLEGFPIPERHVHLEEGWPGEAIPAIARREGADMIVMGTLARVGIPGLFIGNTAERALDHVDCDVLAIKPKGFVTLVRLSDER